MNEITSHENYREIISRIKLLSTAPQENILNFDELKHLQAMAIAYELKRYDFTIGFTDTRQFSIAG